MTVDRDILPGVDVHTVDLSVETADWANLTEAEKARRFRLNLHRHRFLAGRSALRWILGEAVD